MMTYCGLVLVSSEPKLNTAKFFALSLHHMHRCCCME
jgi:hypothetical protein